MGAFGGAGLGGSGGAAGASGTNGSAGSSGSGGGKSMGCGKAPTLTSGNRTIQSAGQNRSYILRIPNNYDNNRPHRLVFGYHWRGGTMQDVDGGGTSGAVWSYYGLRAQADDTTIFVAPQGIDNGWQNTGDRDLTFTDDMVELIQNDLCVDKGRVFALGFSYGGGMSYALACGRPSVFRAVAVYSGGVLSGCDGGTQPVAYLGIHGLGDGTLPITGGRTMRDRFVENNGCTDQDPPEPNGGSQMHTCTTYQGCMAGYPVRWCAFDGGHTPGVVDGGGDDGARTWTKAEAWEFFSQF
jgi:poly(3-hydroxybutyrate) depolymerase